MEQLQRMDRGEMRGAMNVVSIERLEEHCRRWVIAGEQVVQQWTYWEDETASFFALDDAESIASMHGLMRIAVAIVSGPASNVKPVIRDAEPTVLLLAEKVLGHLAIFSAVFVAERRFRACELACDWSLTMAGKQAIIRSELRAPKKEVEH